MAAAFLGGCQRPEETTDKTTGTSAGTSAPAPSGAKLKIVYIPKSTGNPYFTSEIEGFKDACKDLGCDFLTTGPAKAGATDQIPFIKEQIQQKVDVIAITPNSPDALNQVLDDAKAKGILVITVDADLVGNEGHREACVLPTDFTKVGESQVELLGSEINYEGEIAILSATRDAPNQNLWVKGMVETLKLPKYAKMKLVDTVYGDDDDQKSATETDALLTKHPNLKGIISPTSVGLASAARSLELAGSYPGGPQAKNGGVYLTGLSTPNQMKKALDKGVVKAFQLWVPRDMGYLACNLAYQIKTGKTKVTDGGKFTVGKNDYTFEKNGVVNTGPLTTFDKSNIATFDF